MRHIISLCILLKTLLLLISARVISGENLESFVISVYDVSHNTVEIDWHSKVKQLPRVTCEMVYGPVNDPAEVQVYTDIAIIPEEHIFKLSGLENNITYHLHMSCHDEKGQSSHSNILQFTTGSKASPLNYVLPQGTFRGHSSLTRNSFYFRDDEHSRTVRSSNVILGAVCGIVGFLIINVTIVMVVRKYSHWQMHRRRMMEIEEQEYEEFPYPRGYE